MFQGFQEEAIQFLWGIFLNNERGWFLEHKADYTAFVYTPLRALAEKVQQDFLDQHPELELNLHVSRIYRDARRLHGKGPYKNHLWFSLRREDKDWAQTPVFWFELRPTGYGYGLGIYSAKPALMAKFRKILEEAPGEMADLARRFQKQKRFALTAPEYCRSRGTAAPPLDQWINRKTLDLSCEREPDALLASPALVQELLDGFSFLLPYYTYFDRLCRQEDD